MKHERDNEMSSSDCVTFLQTADPFRYADMLALTARSVVEYCERHGFSYESYIGVKKGFWPWQATYNRIVQLQELLGRGYDGWAIYLDADAYIVDLDFPLRQYLADKSGFAGIFTPSMSTDQRWDVNIGVCLFNCGHPVGREIIAEWFRRFMAIPIARLQEAEVWLECDNDQDLIQQMLISKPELLSHIYLQDTSLMNSSHATFIRQHLRHYSATFEQRMDSIEREINHVMKGMPLRHLSSDVCEEVAEAVYWGVLQRAPDDKGRAVAVAGIKHMGLKDGLRGLLQNVVASREFAQLWKCDFQEGS